jgi:hypothetical protein
MPTVSPGSSATSTQLPLAKLKELLTQRAFTCSLLMAGCGQSGRGASARTAMPTRREIIVNMFDFAK